MLYLKDFIFADMGAVAAAAMETQLQELREAAYKAKLAQMNSDIKVVVALHKAGRAKMACFPLSVFPWLCYCFYFSFIFVLYFLKHFFA